MRPPAPSCLLPPGLMEESFDVDSSLGRINVLTILYNTVSAVNRNHERIAQLILILSGPVTYFYKPGGGIPWEEIGELTIHPLNLKNVGVYEGGGTLSLTRHITTALDLELSRSGFTVAAHRSITELGGARITVYNPVEIGFSSSLWDTLDPATAIYIGSPGDIRWLKDAIAFLPDKRTRRAGEFENDARSLAATGDLRGACRSLAGAAQVLGRVRLRSEIVQACGISGSSRQVGSYIKKTSKAREALDALWRYHAGDQESIAGVPLEPVSITLPYSETGDFIALCRELGIVCVATRNGDVATISLDKRELERRATHPVPAFLAFFEEVTVLNGDTSRLFRIRDKSGILRYYDFKKV